MHSILFTIPVLNEEKTIERNIHFLMDYLNQTLSSSLNFLSGGSIPENSCRDAVARELKTLLPGSFSINPEQDSKGDKRIDICISYKNLQLPIEIKKDTHPDLWTAHKTQLKKVSDGGKKPTSAQDLKTRLQAMIPEEDRNFIHICVLDVSWPN